MGSLDAQAFRLDSFEAETTTTSSYGPPPHPQGYNPFAAGYTYEASSPNKSTGGYYNPFSLDYAGPEDGYYYDQGPPRVCSPPYSYGGHQQPYYHQPHPSGGQDPFTFNHVPNEAIIPYCSHRTRRSQRLLWLSEEEAEIIRLIRLSQMKEGLRFPGLSPVGNLSPPVRSPTTDHRDNFGHLSGKMSVNTPSKSSNVSGMSVDEFSLPASAYSMKNSARTVDSDDGEKQWMVVQRQKMKGIEAHNQHFAAVRIQRTWRGFHSRRMRPVNAQPRAREKMSRFTISEATRMIQRAWLKRKPRKKSTSPGKILPKSLKEFYDIVRNRHASKGLKPPAYVKFLMLMERMHAASEGARVRRRLKSRRLQAIVKEIKEIRSLLEEMSNDTTLEPSQHFLTQLCSQLRVKQVQLLTALQAGDAARSLLRRGPATPLLVQSSRSTSPSRLDHGSFRETVIRAHHHAAAEVMYEEAQPSPREEAFEVEGRQPATEVDYDSSNRLSLSLARKTNKGTAAKPVSDSGYEDQPEQSKPKRPFLKRKSVAIPPQKLDWSKVKPMVSSRLEPELKTRLQKNKAKKNALQKKMNYSKVKSRLFNYQVSSGKEEMSACFSSERSIASDASKQYAALNYREETWRPSSVEDFLQREVVQNFRYADENGKAEPCDSHLFSREPSEAPLSSREHNEGPQHEPGPNPNGTLDGKEEKNEEHSFRYKGTASEASPRSNDNRVNLSTSTAQASVVSHELEATLKHVLLLKNESRTNLQTLFGSSNGRSMIPRICPDSNIFHGTFLEKRRLHEKLIQEGRASKLKPDSLAFVSTQD